MSRVRGFRTESAGSKHGEDEPDPQRHVVLAVHLGAGLFASLALLRLRLAGPDTVPSQVSTPSAAQPSETSCQNLLDTGVEVAVLLAAVTLLITFVMLVMPTLTLGIDSNVLPVLIDTVH